tara:strand:- start:27239 stop:27424 length:186 start_codon:yes stop_codon:yes gene_type:complete
MSRQEKCPNCSSSTTIALSSVDKILCADCWIYSDWKLKEGQPSVLIEGKKGDKQESMEQDL